MSADTHINSYIQDVEDAEKEVLAAFSKYKTAVENLKQKYASHVAAVAQAVGQSVPEIEALVPSAKPALDTVEQEAQKVEQAAGSNSKSK